MRLLPWLLTIGIFMFILQRVPLNEVVSAVRHLPLGTYLALMLPYSLIYCGIDAFVLSQVIGWFHTPVSYRRILPVRAAAYILALLNPGLGHGAVAFALHRREGVPLLEVTGSLLFLSLIEFCQLALYAALGIFAFHPHLRAAFAPVYGVCVVVVGGGLLALHKGIHPVTLVLTLLQRLRRGDRTYRAPAWLQHVGLLSTLRRARIRHYLLVLVYKAPNFLCAVVVHYLALALFEVHVPFVRLLAFLPIVFLVASLPITVAHLGTTQAAWLYFFSAYGTPSRLLAYSLVAHLTFMVLNALIGVGFLQSALHGSGLGRRLAEG
ncbi:hypothetical protein NKDENANG_00110 [Candidatus Entotheonellaceae bacterium PAL068K]